MPEYRLTIARRAVKEFEALPADVIERVREKLLLLATDPHPPGAKKLKGYPNAWRLRVGDYRILYEIDDTERIVDVGAIRHRSRSY